MIGKSLSYCIKEICEGRVDFVDVDGIITGTCARTEEDFKSLLESYSSSYWRKFPEKAIKIARNLWDSGRIDQPRTRGELPPNISNRTHWIN